MKKNFLSMGAMVISLLVLFSFSWAQYPEDSIHLGICDKKLKPVHDAELCYQHRETRCEGFYESEIASLDFIELINLTQGNLAYNLSKTDTIKISLPPNRNEKIHLQAKAIALRTYYRMDAQIDSNSMLEWPVADVLYRSEMSPDMIGVIGWFENQHNDKIYIPLKAVSREKPISDNKNIHIVLRSTIDLVRIYYSVFSYQDSTATGLEPVSDFSTPAGAPITIFLELEQPGLYSLDLVFKIPEEYEEEEYEEEEDEEKDNWDSENVFILL